MNTFPNQFVMNTTWTWRRDIEVAGPGDCRSGGWEAYGVFKNQGECVSYFKTDGRNEAGQNVPGSN